MRIKKLSLIILVSSIIFSLATPSAFAGFSYPSPAEAIEQIMSSLGVNQTELKNNIQVMNVSRQKKTPPQVSLSFTPASPVPGSEITAAASPSYFMNDTTKLYFTWYLKHNNAGGGDGHGNDDLNDDGRINIEDYKIAAMRLIASGNFEWNREDVDNYAAHTDSDGYRSAFGGDDQRNKREHCFIHNVKTGDESELPTCKHLFPNAPEEETGDDHFNLDEEKFWHTNPNSSDTTNTGTFDEAAVVGLGKNTFSWTYISGDQVGVAVEGVSIEPTSYADASYKTMWAMPKNTCEVDTTERIPTDDSTQTQTTSIDPDTQEKTITTTTITNHYSTGDYVVKTGYAPGIAVLTSKTIVVHTQKYHYNSFTGAYDDVAYDDTTTTPEWVNSANEPFSGDEINLFYDDNTRYPNPSEAAPTDQTLTVSSDFDLNDCLESNLIDPAEGNSDKNMTIDLSYLPTTPMNGVSSDNSNELSIQSSILNIENAAFINYDWTISEPADSMSSEFLAMNSATKKSIASQTSGINLSSLKIKLAFDNQPNTFYIKVTLRAKEIIAGEVKKEGVKSIIIPIYNSANTIKIFPVAVSDASAISLVDTPASLERCKDGVEKIICPVVKNEIVGMKTDINPSTYNIIWSLNGTSLQQNASDPSIAYFPILQNQGTRYTVTLDALNKNSAEKITLTKTFAVTNPTVTISSADMSSCAPILLGHYVDPINKNPNPDTDNNSLWPDYSADSFAALQGKMVTLKPTFNYSSSNTFSWFLDGVAITSANAPEMGASLTSTGELSFIADKKIGESYSVEIGDLYTQPKTTKKALYDIWNVPATAFYEKPVGNSINIKVTNQLAGEMIASTRTPKQKVLASLFAEIPTYISFLLRIALTIILILATTNIIFSFFPKQSPR
ncbi:MAG: hypothetical protein UT50_C0003G0013 [Candidatus Moranbacteria bacterium GW2011_GWA2_39_41]|nr:MAG: hypothetical protein UT50_C0003G0013 [Candidatus Moranbacteria bacterium GW2011_GWA2_39_41]